jgi:HD-GYP domain-containing protein (c-di-GMP phosphodiesterase class II)
MLVALRLRNDTALTALGGIDGMGNRISEGNDKNAQPDVAEPSEQLISVLDAASVTVRALSRALELRDYRRGEFAETRDHCERVTRIAMRLTEAVAPQLVDDPQLEYGFRLHDIGMLAISDTILLKQGALTERELDEVREHPWLGERIVAHAPFLNGVARQVIGSHHEKWDGSGYPRRLANTEIPLPARIFALADAFDSMTSDQPYRRALPFDFALSEIDDKAGSHFDPQLTRAFLSIAHDLRSQVTPEPAVAAVATAHQAA